VEAAKPIQTNPAPQCGAVPPVLEVLGVAEVEHGARGNRMRAC